MSPLDNPTTEPAVSAALSRDAAAQRLSDKILSAFNHAYAVGERETARRLRQALIASETGGKLTVKGGDRRHGYDPVGQADLWVNFVDARNSYKTLCEKGAVEDTRIAAALDLMKAAYRRWSAG